jgi:transcriptional regulator with XRE-family HTH domain
VTPYRLPMARSATRASNHPGATAPARRQSGRAAQAMPEEDSFDAGTVGRVLRLARARRGWSIREVARRTGFPNTYLSQIERAVIRRPDAGVLWELATLYNLDFPLLAEWSGQLGGDTGNGQPLLVAALRAFSALDDDRRVDALRYLERLGSDTGERA